MWVQIHDWIARHMREWSLSSWIKVISWTRAWPSSRAQINHTRTNGWSLTTIRISNTPRVNLRRQNSLVLISIYLESKARIRNLETVIGSKSWLILACVTPRILLWTCWHSWHLVHIYRLRLFIKLLQQLWAPSWTSELDHLEYFSTFTLGRFNNKVTRYFLSKLCSVASGYVLENS